MPVKDPRIDAYIAKAAPFAQPILKYIRRAVHQGCPAAEETLKWGHPAWTHQGILCMASAFKAHCALTFWQAGRLAEKHGQLSKQPGTGMGQFGRITSLKDLPSEARLIRLVKGAAELNEKGLGVKKKANRKPKPPLPVPDYLAAALKKSKKAAATFEGLSPSHRREYIEWITGAKAEATRLRRLKTAIEWLAQGKKLNWKYENC